METWERILPRNIWRNPVDYTASKSLRERYRRQYAEL